MLYLHAINKNHESKSSLKHSCFHGFQPHECFVNVKIQNGQMEVMSFTSQYLFCNSNKKISNIDPIVNEVNSSHASPIVMNTFSVEIPNIKIIYFNCWITAALVTGIIHSFRKGRSRPAKEQYGLHPSHAVAKAGSQVPSL